VITPDDQIKRLLKKERIGTIQEYPTRRLAERELDRRLSAINRLDYRPKRTSTFGEFAEQWQTRVASQYKPSMHAAVKSHLKTHLVPKLGDQMVGAIGAFEIQDFVSRIRVSRGKKGRTVLLPPSGKTVKNLVSTLSLMQATAAAWKYADRDWFTGLVLPEWIKPEEYRFRLEEARRIINTAQEPFKTFFWVIAETRIRLGEACALRPRDFRLELRVVVIRWSAWRSIHIGSTKGKRPRIFDLSPQLAEHLRLFTADKGAAEFLFQREDGTPWQGDHVVRNHLKPLLKRLGIKLAGAHAFRHLNASLMDQLRTPDKVRQERLGHLDLNDVTINIYSHSESRHHRAVAEQLGKMLAPGSLVDMPTTTITL
jgi:integrase